MSAAEQHPLVRLANQLVAVADAEQEEARERARQRLLRRTLMPLCTSKAEERALWQRYPAQHRSWDDPVAQERTNAQRVWIRARWRLGLTAYVGHGLRPRAIERRAVYERLLRRKALGLA